MVWVLITAFAPVTAKAEESLTGNVNVFLGTKALNEDDWSPAENQTEAGVELDFESPSWPVSLVLGLRGSSGEGDFVDPLLGSGSVEGKTSELSLGIKKIWAPDAHTHPFVGGGLAFVEGEFSAAFAAGSVSDSDTAVGIWLGGGVYWTLGEHFNVGLDLRLSSADVTLFSVDGAAGGAHIGVLLGYHF
jgi:hypothetical protein